MGFAYASSHESHVPAASPRFGQCINVNQWQPGSMSAETQSSSALVVISYYDRRPVDDLHQLLKTIREYAAGIDFNICVVVNSTSETRLNLDIELPIEVLYRSNLGMNIGGWDYGGRNHRSYDDYLFLQDECYVVRKGWLAAFRRRGEEVGIGMVGESINQSWDRSWDELHRQQEGVVLPDHVIDSKGVNRVDYYLKYFIDASIDPGLGGRHLRSLVWYFRGDVLSQLGGFPIGRNYAECIAAEIGVSKRVESLGLRVEQVDKEPFRYIRHREWNQDGPGAPFTHSSTIKRRIAQLENPSWRMLRRMFARKLSDSLRGGKDRRP